jgi:hypothetical protein
MTGPPLEPLQDLREQFRAAAARQVALDRPPKPWRRRGPILVAAAVVATGGVAVGTQLISTGRPAKEAYDPADRYRPAELGTIAITAPDPDFRVPWGVLIYRSAGGETCALVGQVRGNDIGVVTDGVFHPFASRTAGACGDADRLPTFFDVRNLHGRTLLYGRARRDVHRVMLAERGEPQRVATTGPGGAYLFVLEGRLKQGSYRLTLLGADGRPVG